MFILIIELFMLIVYNDYHYKEQFVKKENTRTILYVTRNGDKLKLEEMKEEGIAYTEIEGVRYKVKIED